LVEDILAGRRANNDMALVKEVHNTIGEKGHQHTV
jgi:hypothetical protein